jgi:hypothetical protein
MKRRARGSVRGMGEIVDCGANSGVDEIAEHQEIGSEEE